MIDTTTTTTTATKNNQVYGIDPTTVTDRILRNPALFKALRYSYGIRTNNTQRRLACSLAPTVREIRPAVFAVGKCTTDLWRMGCTCSEARRNKRAEIAQASKPCVHFIALYIAGVWCPADIRPTQFLESMGYQKPRIIATYCKMHLPNHPPAPEGYRLIEIQNSEAELLNITTGTSAFVRLDEVKKVTVFYA